MPKEHHGWSPIVFWSAVGATAVVSGITIWSGVDTQNNPGPSRVRDECKDSSCALYQEGLNKQRRTNILLGVTGGFGVATVLIGAFATDWSFGSQKKPEAALLLPGARRLALVPLITPEGGGVVASGRF